MKRMRHLVIAVVALGAVSFHSSQVGAETSLEIRLTLLPANSVNLAGPPWTSCTGSRSAPPETGGAVHTMVTCLEKGEREVQNCRLTPVPVYRPAVHYEGASKPGVDGTPLSATGATLRHGVVADSLALRAIRGMNDTEWNRSAKTPLHASFPIALEQPVKFVKPTIAGGEEVLVLPIRIRTQNGLVPHYRKVATSLKIILPAAPPYELDTSRIRYVFQSVPLEQSQPLPRATRVLTQVRIPGQSVVENRHSQRHGLEGAGR